MSVPTTAPIHGPRWGARARTWAELAAGISMPAWTAVADATGIGDGTTVLDVACGSGEFCALAVARGASASGIDAAEGMIEVARDVVPSADLRVGPMESLPWDDSSFDLVTGFNAFQFAADAGAALAEARRVARPGGNIAVCAWDDRYDSDLPAVFSALRPLQPPPPTGPTAFPIAEAFAAAGLEPWQEGEIDVPFEAPDEETLVRALTSPGGGVHAAIAHVGERAVRAAILAGAEPYARPDGSFRFRNRFRYLIART